MAESREGTSSGRARRAARTAALYCVEALPARLDGDGTARRDDLALKHLATWVAAVTPSACLDALAQMRPPVGRRAALAALALAEENAHAAAAAAATAAGEPAPVASADLRVPFLEARCANLAADASARESAGGSAVSSGLTESLDTCVEELAALFVEVVLAHRAASRDVDEWEREPLDKLARRAAKGAVDARARLRLLALLGAPMQAPRDGAAVAVGSAVELPPLPSPGGAPVSSATGSSVVAGSPLATLTAPLACTDRLLGRLPPGMLMRERAALLGRIGKREAALAVLACDLGDLRAAEAARPPLLVRHPLNNCALPQRRAHRRKETTLFFFSAVSAAGAAAPAPYGTDEWCRKMRTLPSSQRR